MTIGIIYYTDNRCEERIAGVCRRQIQRCCNGAEIVSVSQFPISDFGRNIIVDLPRKTLSIFQQTKIAIEAATADILFLTEHDVLYHPSHFECASWVPDDVLLYNQNRWQVDGATGHALFRITLCTSFVCAHRTLLVEYFREFFELVE
jgi:hypothetical protein